MLPEKHDSLFDLQRKLDALDEVPGEPTANHAVLWEKLHQRLENKPKKTYAFVYWAAACFLLAIGFIYFEQSKHDNNVGVITKQQSTKTKRQHDPQQTTTTPIIVNPKTTTKSNKENITVKKAHQLPTNNPQNHYHQKDTILTATLTDDKRKETITQAFVQPDTVLHTLAQAPVKKLKVIHINTLGKPKPAAGIVAPGTQAITAQTTKPDYTDHVPALSFSRNNSDEIIKVKLTPTN